MSTKFKALAALTLCFIIAALPTISKEVAGSSEGAIVFVYPDRVTVTVNSTFQIFINVSGASGLQGFDFMLTYNSTLLNCSEIAEGDLLTQFGPTFVVKRDIDNSIAAGLGRVWFVDVIYGVGCTDGRNGTLAVITFKALAEGQTVLDLFSNYPLRGDSVKLTTCPGVPISNTALDGLVLVDAQSEVGFGVQSGLTSVDLNDDGIVNIGDLVIVATAYGIQVNREGYVPRADVDQNGVIDIRDLSLVARYYMS